MHSDIKKRRSFLALLSAAGDVRRQPPNAKRSQIVELAEVPEWDCDAVMRIIALSTLRKFWESSPSYADSIEPCMAWYRETLKAGWSTPNKVKAQLSNASILRDGRVVFNPDVS